ncbi:MAG: outer membrane beta-barrel protein [Campylobacterota bacterium]|nr:outer membrane beta-barrel protein [Campylobacterota bacterium]
MKILLSMMLFLTLLNAQRAGPYIGVAYGSAFYDSDDRLSEQHSKIEDGNVRFTLGAYINENFSVELDYTLYKKFYGLYEGGEVEESFSSVGVTALPHWPFYQDTFDLYGKIGAAQLFWNEAYTHSNSDSAGAYLLGVGIGYRIEQYLIKIGYDLTSFSLEDANNNKNYEMRLDYFYTAIEVAF